MLGDAPERAPGAWRPPRAESDRRGQRLGRYVVVDLLGRGGMGVVYKAFDPELDRLVALKLVQPAGSAHDEAVARERLLREARALAKLAHPNVVAVHDVGVLGGDVFLALEYVEGQTLRRWQAASGRTAAEVLRAYVEAGRGLAAAHAAGLVHRDFKPDNVLVSADGRVRVLDFGLVRAEPAPGAEGPAAAEPALGAGPARAAAPPASADGAAAERAGASGPAAPGSTPSGGASAPTFVGSEEATVAGPPAAAVSGSSELTVGGQAVGTLRYMSPEQFAGAAVDARTDQFSFCVALYEALYGRSPFAGETPEARLASMLVGKRVAPPPRSGVPPALGRVLARGLSPEPAARFESMPALLLELTRDRRSWARRHATALGAALGLALVGGGSWAAGARGRADRSALCRGAGERADTVWNDAARAQVRASFAASGLPYAAESLRTVEAELDRYRARWVEARTEACEATRVRGEQSEELLDLRMQCLDGRLARFRSLAATLASADAQAVKLAVQAASSLEPVAGCADVAALRAPVPLPSAAGARARAAALRDELAAVETAYSFWRTDEALRGAERAVEGARALGHPPLLAEAWLTMSLVQLQAGRPAESERALREAWKQAELGNHARLRPQIWTRLSIHEINDHDDGASAIALAELAHAVTADAPPTDPTRLRVERAYLGALSHVDRLDEAERLARELVRAAPDDHNLLHNASLTLTLAGDFDGALALAERELRIATERFGAMHPQTAGGYTSVGLNLQALGRCRESLAAYEAASARQPPHAQFFQVALEGRIYLLLDLGRPRDALALGLEREGDLRATNAISRLHVAVAMAQAHFALGHDAEAAALADDVERRAAALEPGEAPRRVLAELASVFVALGQADRAERHLTALEKALTDRERRNPFHHPLYLSTWAELEALRGRPDAAKQWAERARALLRQVSTVRYAREAPVLFALALAAPTRAQATKLARGVLHELERAECTDPVLMRQIRDWLSPRPPSRRRR
ncbi:MAG TPA: serine/threonine-protein kinase [Polyangiaceae bacterium]|nr:serine/threonine-protein kinase [Polyangiaceae bacterium]